MERRPKVPLVAFLGRTHLRTALAFLVLGRSRCRNQGGVCDGSLSEKQAALLQFGIDLGQKATRQLLLFEQMSELADRRLIRNRIYRKIEPDETTVQRQFLQRVFHGRVRVVEEVLHQVDAEHGLEWNAARPPGGLRVERLDRRKQSLPRNDGIHLLPELLLASFLAAFHQVRIGQAKSLHWVSFWFRQLDGEVFA